MWFLILALIGLIIIGVILYIAKYFFGYIPPTKSSVKTTESLKQLAINESVIIELLSEIKNLRKEIEKLRSELKE